jgi:hypothetical protein
MLNEPLLKVFINVFTKRCKFVLWQIVDGSKWRLCLFHKINGAVVWLMFGQCVHIFFLKHILEFLVLGRNFMCTWSNIWWRKNINKNVFPFIVALMKAFVPMNKGWRHLVLFIPPRSPYYFKFCMFLIRVSHFRLCVVVFQNEDSYTNPFVDYVEQAKTIQWWHEFFRMKWHWKQPCWCGNQW